GAAWWRVHRPAARRRPVHPVRTGRRERPDGPRREGDERAGRVHSGRSAAGPETLMLAPGWPAMLTDGQVTLRPYRRSDARVWSEVRRANEKWLAPWEPTPPGSWYGLNTTSAFRYVLRELRR